MGFLNGRITYVRYRVGGSSPLPFGEELLEQAQLHTIGRHGAADPNDGVAVGWAGGDHVLDVTLDLEKTSSTTLSIWPSGSIPTRSPDRC